MSGTTIQCFIYFYNIYNGETPLVPVEQNSYKILPRY